MNLDEQGFPIITPYSQNPRHPTNQNRMNIVQQPLQDHILQPTLRQYATVPNYGNEPPSPMLQSTPRYPDSSRSIKKEDLNTYIYPSQTDFRGEMNLDVHQSTHADRYSPCRNPYPSDLNSPDTLAMPIGTTSSRLESPEARLVPGPAEAGADFRYQMRAIQSQHQHHPQRHRHGPQPHHQHQNHALNHMQGRPAFFSPSICYSSLDQEHSGSDGGGIDRQPQTQLNSLEYDSREPHARHTPVPAMVYDSLPRESMTVPVHSQQGVRHDTTLSHRGSLASINSDSGSYHAINSPASIPMSNNKYNRGTASSMNTSVPGAHTSSPFSMGPSNRWAGHPSGFDIPSSTVGATSVHGQVSALSSTPASISAPSSLRPILRHSDTDSRSTPESSSTRNNRLRPSTSAQTLSSSTQSQTNSPSPGLSDNESTVGGCGKLFNPDDRESDQDVDANETIIRMSERSSTGRKAVIRAGEEVKDSLAPTKKKKKSKMHRCEVCGKKFPRPSGLRTHMNTHNNEKPYPCGFPGCTRTFGVRSNAKRHLRTHGVVPTPSANPSSTDAPYIVGFCPPMILPQSFPHQQSQLHSVEGGDDVSLGIRLLGDNANIHTQGQDQSDVQHEMSRVPLLKLRWMPPSLTTRTNAGNLREVRDGQQAHGMGEGVEEDDGEDEDDFVGGSGSSIGGVRRTGGGGYDIDVDVGQDDTEDGAGDGGEVDFGENVPRLSIPLHPVVPSSSNNAVSASRSSIRLTVSHPMGCLCSLPCSEGRCPSPSSSRTFTSISPASSTSFAGSNSSLSPSISAYGQHDIEMTNVGGAYIRTGTISREYDVRQNHTEERNSYLEAGSHPYHLNPSQHPKNFR